MSLVVGEPGGQVDLDSIPSDVLRNDAAEAVRAEGGLWEGPQEAGMVEQALQDTAVHQRGPEAYGGQALPVTGAQDAGSPVLGAPGAAAAEDPPAGLAAATPTVVGPRGRRKFLSVTIPPPAPAPPQRAKGAAVAPLPRKPAPPGPPEFPRPMQRFWHPNDPGGPNSCVPVDMREVPVRQGRFRMVVHAGRDIVSNEIQGSGVWEIASPGDMLQPLGDGHSLPSGGVFLDIGGNLGYYSLLFASEGFEVVTVEPMTRNRRAIQGSLCLNPQLRHRITIVPVALVAPEEVARKRCVIRSTNYQINTGNGQLKCGSAGLIAPCAPGDNNCETVPVRTLDSVLNELNASRIDVVKMDIELYECNALRGGRTLFQRYRPMYIQVETEFADAALCVRNLAQEFRYLTYAKGGNTLMVAE